MPSSSNIWIWQVAIYYYIYFAFLLRLFILLFLSFFFLGPLLFFAIISSKEKAVLYIKSTYENCLAIHLEGTVQLKCLSEMRAARFILANFRRCPECDRVFCVISKYWELCKVFYKLNFTYITLNTQFSIRSLSWF